MYLKVLSIASFFVSLFIVPYLQCCWSVCVVHFEVFWTCCLMPWCCKVVLSFVLFSLTLCSSSVCDFGPVCLFWSLSVCCTPLHSCSYAYDWKIYMHACSGLGTLPWLFWKLNLVFLWYLNWVLFSAWLVLLEACDLKCCHCFVFFTCSWRWFAYVNSCECGLPYVLWPCPFYFYGFAMCCCLQHLLSILLHLPATCSLKCCHCFVI